MKVSEQTARMYEIIHEVIAENPGSLVTAGKVLAARAQTETCLQGTAWDAWAIQDHLSSDTYREWRAAYLETMGHHATWTAFQVLSDPKKMPKAIATELISKAARGDVVEAAQKAAASRASGVHTDASLSVEMGIEEEMRKRK